MSFMSSWSCTDHAEFMFQLFISFSVQLEDSCLLICLNLSSHTNEAIKLRPWWTEEQRLHVFTLSFSSGGLSLGCVTPHKVEDGILFGPNCNLHTPVVSVIVFFSFSFLFFFNSKTSHGNSISGSIASVGLALACIAVPHFPSLIILNGGEMSPCPMSH